MSKYEILFETYSQGDDAFDTCTMSFMADDEMHVINQLLDEFRMGEERVCVIDSVYPIK